MVPGRETVALLSDCWSWPGLCQLTFGVLTMASLWPMYIVFFDWFLLILKHSLTLSFHLQKPLVALCFSQDTFNPKFKGLYSLTPCPVLKQPQPAPSHNSQPGWNPHLKYTSPCLLWLWVHPLQECSSLVILMDKFFCPGISVQGMSWLPNTCQALPPRWRLLPTSWASTSVAISSCNILFKVTWHVLLVNVFNFNFLCQILYL